VEVPLREALTGIGPTDEATAPPPDTLQTAVISTVDSITATDDHPPPEPYAVDDGLPLAPLLADDDTPSGFTPPRPSTPLRSPTTATGATDDKLEAFVAIVSKVPPTPLLDKPPRRRRVDPVLVDAPPQLPSSEASGLRRSGPKPWTPYRPSNRLSGGLCFWRGGSVRLARSVRSACL
jgi:hypothetical protein